MDIKWYIAEANRDVVRRSWLTLPRQARSFCGTDADPQNLSRQSEALIEAGEHVFWSNARATDFCRGLLAIE